MEDRSVDIRNQELIYRYLNSLGEGASNPPALYINKNSGLLHLFDDVRSNPLSTRALEDWEVVHITADSTNRSLIQINTVVSTTQVARKSLETLNKVIRERAASRPIIAPTLPDLERSMAQLHLDDDHLSTQSLDKLVAFARTCFGNNITTRIPSPVSIDRFAELMFIAAEERLASPAPLTESDIEEIYGLLFDTALKAHSTPQQDSYHPAVVFRTLREAVDSLRVNGADAKKPTGGGDFLGVNGSFFISGLDGTNKLWVFKPAELEKPIAEGIAPGEGSKREHLACALNYAGTYPIPFTVSVVFGGQEGSAQLYQPASQNLGSLMRNPEMESHVASLPKKELQASLTFDIRFGNGDRHTGNLMCPGEIREGVFVPTRTVMIDHGQCLSTSPRDPLKLEQLGLRQMMEDWDSDLAEQILTVDQARDRAILETFGMPKEVIKMTERATQFLQRAIQLSREHQAEGVAILPYDVGIIAQRVSEAFWEDNKFDQTMRFLEIIVACKGEANKITGEITQTKIVKFRQRFAAKVSEFEPIHRSCLFGDRGENNDGIVVIDWNVSIIGKWIQRRKESHS